MPRRGARLGVVQTVRPDLRRYATVSILTALATMALKGLAWAVTGSVGLLSDALESTVNLTAAVVLAVALRVSARPPDAGHQFGHEKAELFSAGAEGVLIVVAAGLIAASAIDRLLHPRDLEAVGAGLAVSIAAAVLNGAVGTWLLRAGRRHGSLALRADGHHLLTDVWTSAGVVVGVTLVVVTGWRALDPIVALGVGANIVVTGVRLAWRAASDLLDPPWPPDQRAAATAVLDRFAAPGIDFHGVRTRTAGSRRFVEVHVLVPGAWTVAEGHALVERIEAALRDAVPGAEAITHLEPIEDPASYEDRWDSPGTGVRGAGDDPAEAGGSGDSSATDPPERQY